MRCPSCGFENTPGLTTCGVCASPLDGKASPRDVSPPRAKDRRLRATLEWEAQRTGISRLPLPPASSVRRAALVACALVPGVGMWVSSRGGRVAWLHHAASLALLTAGIALIRSPLSDVLFLGVFGLWVWSVTEGLDVLFPPNTNADLPLRRFGLALIAAAVLAGGYSVARVAASPWVWTMRVVQPVQSGLVRRGDSVLVRRLRGAPRRGDVVVASTGSEQYPTLFGPVIGVPGDRLVIGAPVFVNGQPTIASVEGAGGVELVLGPGEYWVRPFWHGNAGQGRGAAAGVVWGHNVRGRVVAVVYPRGRRARIHSESIYSRKD